jgi:Protein of unknown function (DUF4230)
MLRFKWLVLGALLALSVLGAILAYQLIPRPGKIAHALSEAFREKLGLSPAIRIRDWVVVEERKPIAELALVSRDTDIGHRVQSVLLHSRAELSLRAAYRVKAGFDLRSADFSAKLDPGLKQAWLDLPAPRVLSVEMIRYDVLADRSGWWNRISEDEKALAMRDMQARAKLEAIRAGILADCRQRLDAELAKVSARTGVRVAARYRMDPDTASLRLEPAPAR